MQIVDHPTVDYVDKLGTDLTVVNAARVCKLRLDPHAQGETQEVGKRIWYVCAEQFPEAWKALEENFIHSLPK